jgi:hypothetical protein
VETGKSRSPLEKVSKISNKQLLKTDYVELYSANKIRYYHHKKEKREEKVLKKKRLVRRKTLSKLEE